jgi:hypothetical protein
VTKAEFLEPLPYSPQFIVDSYYANPAAMQQVGR